LSDTLATLDDVSRCVVLAPSSTPLDEPLRSQLETRRWQPTLVDDPYAAMAELCLRERTMHTRRAWGLDETRESILVVVGPAERDPAETASLLETLHRYAPGVSIWRWDDARLTLVAAGAAPAAPPPPPAGTCPTPRPTGRPSLRLAVDAGARALEPEVDAPDAIILDDDETDVVADDASEVTPAEIAMLLGAVPDETPDQSPEGTRS
jgi:hypothetical protein